MSLLRDIQDAAVDSRTSLPALLRRCKILAAHLGNAEFKAWVDAELNGYASKEAVPPYRVMTVHSKGHFSGPFQSGDPECRYPVVVHSRKVSRKLERGALLGADCFPRSACREFGRRNSAGSMESRSGRVRSAEDLSEYELHPSVEGHSDERDCRRVGHGSHPDSQLRPRDRRRSSRRGGGSCAHTSCPTRKSHTNLQHAYCGQCWKYRCW